MNTSTPTQDTTSQGPQATPSTEPTPPTTPMTTDAIPQDGANTSATAPANDSTPEPSTSAGLLGDGDTGDGNQDPQSDTLGAPEGDYSQEAMTEADAEIASAFVGAAKELNLSQTAVDKLYGAVAPAMRRRSAELMNKAETEWAQQSRTDPEFGGAQFEANRGQMVKVVSKYCSPELRKVLRESRLDCHPEVLRMFYRISKDISEDTIVKGSGGAERAGHSNDLRGMFPNTKMNL